MVAVAPLLAAAALAGGAHLECPDYLTFAAEAALYTGSSYHSAVYVYADRRLLLRPDICGSLNQLAGGEVPPQGISGSDGFAVFTLAHELAHAAGTTDEASADCAAAGSFVRVAGLLGVDRQATGRLLRESAPFDGYDPNALVGCWPRTAGLPA